MKNYKEQNMEIQALLKSLSAKSENFAKNTKNPHFEDLGYVLRNLKDINTFLK